MRTIPHIIIQWKQALCLNSSLQTQETNGFRTPRFQSKWLQSKSKRGMNKKCWANQSSFMTLSATKEHICYKQYLFWWIPFQCKFILVATRKEGKSLFWTISTSERASATWWTSPLRLLDPFLPLKNRQYMLLRTNWEDETCQVLEIPTWKPQEQK